jgi:hypothetical protein
MYTSPKKEGFQIPAQGFLFVLLLVPVALMATYEGRYGPTDESVEDEIGARYAARIAENRAKRTSSHMAEFFQAAIHQPQDGTKVNDDLHKLLIAGKGGKKRMHAIDEKLYGTAEGVAEKTRQEEQRKEMQQAKIIMQKKKEAEAGIDAESIAAATVDTVENAKMETLDAKSAKTVSTATTTTTTTTTSSASPSASTALDGKSLALVAVVATVAATAGFFAGGSRTR